MPTWNSTAVGPWRRRGSRTARRSQLPRHLVTAGLFLLVACAGPSQSPAPSRSPNILIIVVDDLRWDDFGAAGHAFAETPNIDRLAREGLRFTNAFAATPLCSPSRASILTGQYAHTHGIVDNTARDSASHRLPTFAVPLQQAGYRTGFFGKWHMGNDDSPRPGFTRWVAMRGQGEAIDPKLNVDGTRGETKGYVTDVLTHHVTAFLRESAGQPFLAVLAHKAIHPNAVQRDDGSIGAVAGQAEGFVPAPRHAGRYANREIVRRANASAPLAGKPALQRPLEGLPPLGPATATPAGDVRGRLEMLLAVDESLGRILEVLRDTGELDRTVIIFTSDNGYFYGEHYLNEERRLAYEESIRLPLIVRYPPAVPGGTTRAEMVQTIDLAPTLLELAAAADTVTREGRSLVPLLRGDSIPWRTSVLVEYWTDTVFPRVRNMGYRAIRTDRYKYIRYLELPGMDELYDLQTDPFELENLMGTARGAELLPRLQEELARLSSGDPR